MRPSGYGALECTRALLFTTCGCAKPGKTGLGNNIATKFYVDTVSANRFGNYPSHHRHGQSGHIQHSGNMTTSSTTSHLLIKYLSTVSARCCTSPRTSQIPDRKHVRRLSPPNVLLQRPNMIGIHILHLGMLVQIPPDPLRNLLVNLAPDLDGSILDFLDGSTHVHTDIMDWREALAEARCT